MANSKHAARGKSRSTVQRPIVTGVTVNVLYPDGTSRTYTIDPSRTEALFWSDRAVLEILAPFYQTIEKHTTPDELRERFGDEVMSLDVMRSERVRITPSLVGDLWTLRDSSRKAPAFIQKTRNCIPRPQPQPKPN
jgi:NAD(P)-dependent dehydrogenase (short-subunit alcohol dehydrogenase family)